MKKSEIIGGSVLILGYGREGRSAHRFLLRNFPTKKIGLADKKRVKPGEDYLRVLESYNTVIRSPGIKAELPQLQKYRAGGGIVTSATNIFFSCCPGKIIGVTGTKGKSTTASLIARVLKKKYSDVRLIGNIGRPALDFLPGATRDTLFVMELSSQQLEDLKYSPHFAVILAIYPEHLDYHKRFSDYIQAKSNIVSRQKKGDFIIFNPTHRIINEMTKKSPARKFCFSLGKILGVSCCLEKGRIFVRRQKKKPEMVMKAAEIPLLGRGNTENILAAISVGVILGVPLKEIRQAIKKFKPLVHRLEFVGERQDIRFYNDSLATIPQATMQALAALGADVQTLIAGGYDRGIDFTELGKFLAKRKLKNLILFPTTGEKIWQAVWKASKRKSLLRKYDVFSMEEAVRIAFKTTSPGKICLLSPASASYGLFRDYRQRGNLFKKFILGKTNR